MKTISKHWLDETIRLTRKYYKTGDVDLLGAMTNASHRAGYSISHDENYPNGLCVSDICSALFSGFGLKPHATNQDVYDIFALLGYELYKDAEPESEIG